MHLKDDFFLDQHYVYWVVLLQMQYQALCYINDTSTSLQVSDTCGDQLFYKLWIYHLDRWSRFHWNDVDIIIGKYFFNNQVLNKCWLINFYCTCCIVSIDLLSNNHFYLFKIFYIYFPRDCFNARIENVYYIWC